MVSMLASMGHGGDEGGAIQRCSVVYPLAWDTAEEGLHRDVTAVLPLEGKVGCTSGRGEACMVRKLVTPKK